MRKITTAIIIFLAIHLYASAQDQRALTTKIADVLATMPAQDKQQLDKSMEEISSLNENGIVQMLGMFSAQGSGDNTALEYAIGGYSSYVMQPGKEQQRQMAVRAYCASLDKLPDNKSKQFIIQQLQDIGKDDAVPCLEKYLHDEQLSGPAARALALIGTPASEKVLASALSHTKDSVQLSLIEALGYAGYKPAVSSFTALAKTGQQDLRKVVLYALARIGDPSSASLLQSAVQKAGYAVDNTEALAAYLLFLHQLAANGNSAAAEKSATKLLNDANATGQAQTKIAALQLLVDINKEKSLPLLYKAMQDDNMEYRAAALSFASTFRSPASNKQWLQTLSSVSPAARVQVIHYLAQSQDETLLPAMLNLLKDKNKEVRIAAIDATQKTGQQNALPDLLDVMKKGDADEITTVKNSILLMKGDKVTTTIAGELNNVPAAAKVALIEVLAAREADHSLNDVLAQLSSSDTSVHRAAVEALPFLVAQKDLAKLFSLLNTAESTDVNSLQQAVIAASAEIKDTVERTKVIIEEMRGVPKEKQLLYFNVLAAIGGDDALNAVQSALENGDEQTKTAAVTALSKANGAKAARMLLHIAGQNNAAYSQAALNGYIDIIHRSSFPGDQKLLMLKEAMSLAQNDAQKKNILEQTAGCQTFLALLFAGNYLDDPAVQQEAAMAIMNIALSNNEFTGDAVRTLLNKTMDVVKGQDADYQKQAIKKHLAEMPAGSGFVALFNGKDLTGWKGLVASPIERAKMNADTRSQQQEKATKIMREGWFVKDGLLVFSGKGENLCTEKQYGDFEMFVDWKITKDGDAGIYLRGSPQVQIWDTSRRDVGAEVGSGGLYNNQKNPAKPLVLADNAIDEWNTFNIIMRGDKVTVYLNGQLVTDNVVLENYWNRSIPIFPKEQIELQAHGTYVAYRNIYIKELTGSQPFVLSDEEKKEGFKVLFDGTNLDQWTGNKTDYKVDNGDLLIDPKEGEHGNLFTKEEFSNFIFRFEFQLTPGANNGVGIRAPLEGDIAYTGMEIQILDNDADIYKDLQPYQYHGSVYGVIPAKRGFLKPVGEWNYEEIIANSSRIKVILNNEAIVDGDINEASKNGTMDHKEHPGLKRPSGHIGLLGHGSVVRFRNIRVKAL